jgi:hypothetical protein
MGKLLEMKSKPVPRTDLAAEVLPKLAAAKAKLAELEAQAAAAMLSSTLGEQGATAKLAQINAELDTAQRSAKQLQAAYDLAMQRDAAAVAAADAQGRRIQLTEMKKRAAARLASMEECCTALETASKAYAQFLAETDAMAIAMPTGMVSHSIAWHMLDIMLDGRPFPALIEIVMRGEMWRHADLTRQDRPTSAALPGASPPTENLRLRPTAIEPCHEAVRRMNGWVLGLIEGRIKSIEQADAAKYSKSA